jgi:hypothetical protein
VYVFRTRLPVASERIATPLLPHDLHVLSLPLAFILSQDQTLHCKCCLILTLLIQRINVVKSNVIRLTYLFPDLHRECCYFPTFKDLLAFHSLARDDEPPIFFMGVQSYRPYHSQPKLFASFRLIFNFFKRTSKKNLKRIAKIQPDDFTTNFYRECLYTFITPVIHFLSTDR